MSEADGVDGGAICAAIVASPKDHRGTQIFIRVFKESFYLRRGRISFLPFGQARRKFAYVDWHRRWCSRARLSPKLDPTYSTYSLVEVVKSRATVSPWVSRSSNLHAVGPGSEVLVICRNLIGCKYHLANGCVL
ncbi:hypothetical protein V1477_013504 [Vespula maculifrons]|uniref:Uncharacterized protein n=1 Tax=Vespula maculifrons TaxID=7453 RepID=A0ABD2BQC4_VESMC